MANNLDTEYSIVDLAQDIIDEYSRCGGSYEINWNKVEECIEIGGDDKAHLGSMYSGIKGKTVEERAAYIRWYVQTLLTDSYADPGGWEHIKHNVFPYIATDFDFEKRRLYDRCFGSSVSDELKLNGWALGADLNIELMIRDVNSTATISVSKLQEIGVSIAQAKSAALSNLWAQGELEFDMRLPNIWVSAGRDNFDACRLLMVDKIQALPVEGHAVVFIPYPNMLIVVGNADANALHVVYSLLVGSEANKNYVSLMPYHLINDQWQYYSPLPRHPMSSKIRGLSNQYLLDQYGEQKSWLDSIFKKERKKIDISTYSSVRSKETFEYTSWASWTDRVNTYLPKVDKISLHRASESGATDSLGFVKWQQLEAVSDNLFKKVSEYPERYLVSDFPDKSVIQQLEFEDINLPLSK